MKPSKISIHCSFSAKTAKLLDDYVTKLDSETMRKHFRTDVVRIAVEEFLYNSTIKEVNSYD
jgi:hypothetical protein